MDQLLKKCVDNIIDFMNRIDYQNKTQLNAYITIYDKLKEIEELIESPEIANDVLEERIDEFELEQDLLQKFGPSILLYLLTKTAK